MGDVHNINHFIKIEATGSTANAPEIVYLNPDIITNIQLNSRDEIIIYTNTTLIVTITTAPRDGNSTCRDVFDNILTPALEQHSGYIHTTTITQTVANYTEKEWEQLQKDYVYREDELALIDRYTYYYDITAVAYTGNTCCT